MGDEDTCPRCGALMVTTFMFLTTAQGCKRVPYGSQCPSAACREEAAEEWRRGQAARDKAAIEKAIERGVIRR